LGFDVRRGGEDEPFKDVRRGGGGYFLFPPWGGGGGGGMDLFWNDPIKKGRKRLYFLKSLKNYGAPKADLIKFYKTVI
jgi:hypothetical protein